MTTAVDKRRLLSLGPPPLLPPGADWDVVRCANLDRLLEELPGADLVLLAVPENFDPARLTQLLDAIERSPAVGVLLLPPQLPARAALAHRRGQCLLLPADVSPEVLAAKVEAAAALQPAIRQLQAELQSANTYSASRLRPDYDQLTEEMRLAARLQRDFLPRVLPQVPPVSFATLFRPASWVSGDLYDVFRLDEEHIGFYVADVVGHGMPAALLTMFIKKSLQTKRIEGHSYRIVPPDQALAQLNEDICQQDLSSCQFCTAVYAIINTRTLVLEYARAGHPIPLLASSGGPARALESAGMLLGVFPAAQFECRREPLRPGDRLAVFTDGVEDLLDAEGGREELARQLERLARVSPEAAMLELTARIDRCRTDSDRSDDVTLLMMDIA